MKECYANLEEEQERIKVIGKPIEVELVK